MKKDVTDPNLEADVLATMLVKYCEEQKVSENVAQAALGTAWMSLCHAIGISDAKFKEILKELPYFYDEL